MCLEATVWAMETPAAKSPLDRLLLILLADCTDHFGSIVVDVSALAAQACTERSVVVDWISRMVERGILSFPPPSVEEEDMPGDIAGFILSAWADRDEDEAAPSGVHPS